MIWEIFSALVANILSALGNWTWRNKVPWIKWIKRKPSLWHDAATRLEYKYPHTDFKVAQSESVFHQLIATTLIDHIEAVLQKPDPSGPDVQRVRVGLVCGPMVFKTIEALSKMRRCRRGDFTNVSVIAMNRAAESRTFQYSANFLATAMSQVLPGSLSFTYTSNPYDVDAIRHEREHIDILLCSAGSAVANSPNYVNIFQEQMAALKRHPRFQPLVPDDWIGDFCLTPIDETGCVVSRGDTLKSIQRHIDPYPQFKHLGSWKQKNKNCTVILPVQTPMHSDSDPISDRTRNYTLTDKERITATLLRMGLADTCIVGQQLATNLAFSVGDYLLTAVSEPNDVTYHRRAVTYSFATCREEAVTIHDRNDRLQNEFSVGVLGNPPESVDRYPAIIVSELSGEARAFDWIRGVGSFEYVVNGKSRTFKVDAGVRQPGQWGLATADIVRKCVSKLSASGREKVSLWDVGCGCGVVGIAACLDQGENLGQLVLSDVSKAAVDCARENVEQLLGSQPSERELFVGHFFEVARDRKVDVIALTPPFLPIGVTDRDAISTKVNDALATALEFCRGVPDHLSDRGWVVLTVADYVDDGRIAVALRNAFGEQSVEMYERSILYPRQTGRDIPVAFEIENTEAVESICGYRFENYKFGECEFLGFKMRHYCAQNR